MMLGKLSAQESAFFLRAPPAQVGIVEREIAMGLCQVFNLASTLAKDHNSLAKTAIQFALTGKGRPSRVCLW